MRIQIAPPLAIHHIGKRANNEDNIYPPLDTATTDQRLFLVCDGVGGAARGEVASEIACEQYAQFFERRPPYPAPDDAYFETALQYVTYAFDAKLLESREHKGMATTMTLLYLHPQGATIAHIGDSRVYHIRGDEVRFVTSDHSLVNQLVQAGIITPEEARRHPQRNVITQAIQGGGKRTKTAVAHLTDIQPNDYFFLCSDGVLESIESDFLAQILAEPNDSDQDKINRIEAICADNSRDNFSAYLVRIAAVELDDYDNAESTETPDAADDDSSILADGELLPPAPENPPPHTFFLRQIADALANILFPKKLKFS